MRDISPKDAEQKINKEEFTVIDVRTPEEYGEGCIAESLNIDVSSPDFSQKIQDLDRNREYLVYCRSGGRSSRAREFMEKSGFKNVYNLTGGIIAWNKMGLPIEK
jgi:rhodanese-related sulfurtransferase